MKHKAIIFDLDGTAIPNHAKGLLPSKLVKTIQLHQKDIHLCAATTGRPIANAKYIIDALEINRPVYRGGRTQIYDPVTDAIIWEASLEPGNAQNILKICQNYHYQVLAGNELLGEEGAIT